jgi:hypothetical protein
MYSLIGSAKMNGIDPQAWLADLAPAGIAAVELEIGSTTSQGCMTAALGGCLHYTAYLRHLGRYRLDVFADGWMATAPTGVVLRHSAGAPFPHWADCDQGWTEQRSWLHQRHINPRMRVSRRVCG